MRFQKFYDLLFEADNSFSIQTYGNQVKSAYKIIFDLDDSDILQLEPKDLLPPSYCHNYWVCNIKIAYNNKFYSILHKIYHFKIPEKSIKNAHETLDYEGWENFLKQMEEFERLPLTIDMIKNRNIQLETKVTILGMAEDTDDYFKKFDIGRFAAYDSLANIVNKVKTIIDKIDGDNEEEEFSDPVTPNGNLVAA